MSKHTRCVIVRPFMTLLHASSEIKDREERIEEYWRAGWKEVSAKNYFSRISKSELE